MRAVPLADLENKIVRPGFEKHLRPLVMYRGNLSLGGAHRMWNLIVSGMEHEATLADLTQRLQLNADYSQLCGPEKRREHLSIYGFLGRLGDNPKVMGEMPGLADYVSFLGAPRFRLEPVSECSHRRRNMGAGGWRIFKKAGPKPRPVKRDVLVYPFLIHDGGRPEHDLLKRVNAAVSRAYKPHMRADICQDIIVGILSGEFDIDDLNLPAKEMTRRVFKMSMEKYGDLSLDAEIPGTDGIRFIDTLSNEDSIWERI